MIVTIECESFSQCEELRSHLLHHTRFKNCWARVANPVALRIGNRLDLSVKTQAQEDRLSDYCQGWLAGRNAGTI
jgi:hypothetical protein